ncbi:MAG: hypothetical protein ABI167_09145 [Nitrosospira sp.]
MANDQRVIDAFSHMDDSYIDARIKAAFVMAPVMGVAMTKASLKAINVPVYVVVGDKDDQAIPEYNAKLIAALIPGAELQILPNVTHYTFLPICNERGNSQVKELCFSPPGVDRNAVHQQVIGTALDFFSHTLRQ